MFRLTKASLKTNEILLNSIIVNGPIVNISISWREERDMYNRTAKVASLWKRVWLVGVGREEEREKWVSAFTEGPKVLLRVMLTRDLQVPESIECDRANDRRSLYLNIIEADPSLFDRTW